MEIKGKQFKTFIGKDELRDTVARLAGDISRDYADGNLIVCPILTGAFIFAADLVREITIPCEISFVRYSSYSGMSSTGNVKCLLPLPKNVEGRDLLIVEDVIDSGLTIGSILKDAWELHPRSVRVCTMFYKPGAFKGDYKVDYIGREIGNEFIVGYGMDYDEQWRNLPEILVLDEK